MYLEVLRLILRLCAVRCSICILLTLYNKCIELLSSPCIISLFSFLLSVEEMRRNVITSISTTIELIWKFPIEYSHILLISMCRQKSLDIYVYFRHLFVGVILMYENEVNLRPVLGALNARDKFYITRKTSVFKKNPNIMMFFFARNVSFIVYISIVEK